MKRDGENLSDRPRSFPIIPLDKKLELEIHIFLNFVKRSPRSFQQQLAPFLQQLKASFPNDEKIKQCFELMFTNQDQVYERVDNAQSIMATYIKILQLGAAGNLFNKYIDRMQIEVQKNGNKKKKDFEQKKQAFQKIDLIHPDYEVYFKMSKQERDHPLPQQQGKQKSREFYTEPRLIVRMQQLLHFRANQRHKGNILFLHYQGQMITGRKVYAVGNNKSIDIWAMPTDQPIPMIVIPTIPNQKQDDQQRDRQIVKDKKQSIDPNLQFSFWHRFISHSERITSISISRDQYYMISGSLDKTVMLWCIRLKQLLAIYRGHMKQIWDVHFSPAGYYFLSGSADGTMILWKTDVPNAQRIFYHKSEVNKVSFAKDPSFVISAGDDGFVKLWKVADGELVRNLQLLKAVININLGFSGSYLLTLEVDGRISILDLFKGDIVNSFYFYDPKTKRKDKSTSEKPKKLMIHDMCFSQDERELTCITSKYILIYSMDKLEQKVAKNIFTIYENQQEEQTAGGVAPKQAIFMGVDTNMTFCSYQNSNLLVIGGSSKI